MNTRELDALAKALAPVFQQFLKTALASQKAEFEKQLGDIRESIPDLSGVQLQIDALKAVELPEIPDFSSQIEAATTGIIEKLDEKSTEIDINLQKAIESIPEPKNGVDGKSITAEDVRPMIAEMVEALPKPQDGKSVTLEDVRPLIDEAVKAIPVPKDGKSASIDDVLPAITEKIEEKWAEMPKPEPGAQGEKGEAGKDALELEIQPSADFQKTYPRGTYALHKGGLIKSYMQTNGEKGWETVLNGVACVDFEQVDERTVKMACVMTDGTRKESDFDVPAVIDRGVFREETKYLKGDGCTFGGSYWIAQKSSPEGKPGQSDDWRLAVKKGRDAR